jgi:hypothetical protein
VQDVDPASGVPGGPLADPRLGERGHHRVDHPAVAEEQVVHKPERGGGLCRAAAVAQLHQVRRLEDAVCTSAIRSRLLVAIAELASMAGWMAYDVDEHDAARRLWTYALDTARRADGHP